MDNKETNNEENKEIIVNNNSLINRNENKDFLDSNSDSKIMTELKKIDNNEQLNNDLSKSLSEINRNNFEEDKKTISLKSISESNNNYNRPISKKIIVEINQLSQRVSKEENENESNNRVMMKELRLKYFSNKKNSKNIENKSTFFNEEVNPKTTLNNLNYRNEKNNKIQTNKYNLKPNLILEDLSGIKNDINLNQKNKNNENNNYNREKSEKRKQFFLNLLKENVYINNIDISKEELLKLSNEKEKIIYLLKKNKELIDFIGILSEKYKILKDKYIELYKNTCDLENDNFIEESDEYKKYLINENKNMKQKIENFEKIFPTMINYINDIGGELNLKKINFIEVKKYINNMDYSQNNANNKKYEDFFINLLNENKKKIIKRKKIENDNIKSTDKILNKIRSHSNFEDNGKLLLKNPKLIKFKMKNYYNKL